MFSKFGPSSTHSRYSISHWNLSCVVYCINDWRPTRLKIMVLTKNSQFFNAIRCLNIWIDSYFPNEIFYFNAYDTLNLKLFFIEKFQSKNWKTFNIISKRLIGSSCEILLAYIARTYWNNNKYCYRVISFGQAYLKVWNIFFFFSDVIFVSPFRMYSE